jgi:septal ring factor EnvC (AmiA/AmiB activator)
MALKRFKLSENKQSKIITRENKINAYIALKRVYLNYLFDYREDTEKKISDALDDLANDIDKLDKEIEDINKELKK